MKNELPSLLFNPNSLCLGEKKISGKIINILKATQYFSEIFSVRCVQYGEHQILPLNASVMSSADVILGK